MAPQPDRAAPARYAAAAPTSLGQWRYRDLLPAVEPVSLGEGWTLLLPSRRHPGLRIKDEGANPTGTLAARALSVAVSQALQDGIQHPAIASPGPSAVALAAYSAAAGLTAHCYVPQEIPLALYTEILLHNAQIHLVEAPLAVPPQPGHRDLSHHLEGTKTLGYELLEQSNWHYPEAILAPPDALPSLTSAFDDLDHLGWTTGPRPRLYTGHAEAISTPQATAALIDHAHHEGHLLSLEGADLLAAYQHLLLTGELLPTTPTILIDPTSGHRQIEQTARLLNLRRPLGLPKSMPVGGIITPV